MITNFAELHDSIKKEAMSVGLVKRHTVSKKTFADDIRILLGRYQTFIGTIGSFTITDRQSLADRIYEHKSDSEAKGCTTYIAIAQETKARNDHKFAYESMIEVAKAIENVLANFQANIDIIFEGGADVNIHTAKLSHLAAFGFQENAEMYIEYLMDLTSIITFELVSNGGVHELEKPMPYKYKYIADHINEFIHFHQAMMNGGNRTYLNTFKGLKKSLDDVRVANPDTGSNIEMIEDDKLMGISHGLFGQFSLNPFRWLGEQYNLIKNNKYLKMTSEKESMIAHVDLLRMDLANQDPNSPEYAKTIKIIDSYNQMIAKLTQKLEKYYGPQQQ